MTHRHALYRRTIAALLSSQVLAGAGLEQRRAAQVGRGGRPADAARGRW